MSVLPCARSGCGGIMCDRFSYHYGYICEDCFGELCRLPEDTDIRSFMRGDAIDSPDREEYFSQEFPLR